MTDEAKKLLERLTKLTVEEQAEIAAELLTRLHPDDESMDGEAWSKELERRARRAMSGESQGTPWPEVESRIRRDIVGEN